ncbi:hypothetical protein KEM54_005230 [Ascosphaera aggregata]|nr:hypothetical protein KEM54_005230 [Ascosphaera aggregata]
MERDASFAHDATVAKIVRLPSKNLQGEDRCSPTRFQPIHQTQTLLDNVIYNIIHDIVAKVHREEKTTRMRSAVALARQRAEKEVANQRQSTEREGSSDTPPSPNIRIETEGAIYENGKVYLRGNPLSTTKENICPNCGLPRLLYPPYGLGSRPPPDPNRKYCRKVPPIVADGVDAQGIPFVTDKIQRKKKNPPPATNSAIPGAPAANSSLNPTDVANASGTNASTNGHPHPEPPTFPSVKCPNCPRYIVTTRIAQHLERCMGIGGTRRGAGNRTKTPQIADNASVTSNASSTAGQGKDSNGAAGNANVKPSPLKRSMHADEPDESMPLKKKKTWTKKTKDASSSVGGSGTTSSGASRENTKPPIPSKLKKTESNHGSPDLGTGSAANGGITAGEKKKLKLTLKAS